MLFRNQNGSMVIINKYDFKTDELYHKKIKDIKFGKNNLLNTAKNSINYSNGLIDNILQRTSNNFENQE